MAQSVVRPFQDTGLPGEHGGDSMVSGIAPVDPGQYQACDDGNGRAATFIPGPPTTPSQYGAAIVTSSAPGQDNQDAHHQNNNRKQQIGMVICIVCTFLVSGVFLLVAAVLGYLSSTGHTTHQVTSITFNREGDIIPCIRPNIADSKLTGSNVTGTVMQLFDDYPVPFSIMKGSCLPNKTDKLDFGPQEPIPLNHQHPTTMFDYRWLDRGTVVNVTVKANLSHGEFLNMSLFRYNCYYQEKDKCFTDGKYESNFKVTADQNFTRIKIQEPDYYFLKIRLGLPGVTATAIWHITGYYSYYVQNSNFENTCTSNGNSKCEFSIDDRACYFIGPDRDPVINPGIYEYSCTVSSVKAKGPKENLQLLIPCVIIGFIGVVGVVLVCL